MKGLYAYSKAAAWFLTTTTSLLTTKRLLDHEFHFPMHLLLLQLASLLSWKFIRWTCGQISRHGAASVERLSPEISTPSRLLSTICVSGALLCAYQMAHHISNLPVVVMLCSLILQYTQSGDNTSWGCKQVWVVGVALVLMFDYRLSTVGMGMLLLMTVFATLNRFLGARLAKASSDLNVLRVVSLDIEIFDVVGAMCLAAFWCRFREQQFWELRPYSPLMSEPGVLAVNLVSSGLVPVITGWLKESGPQDRDGEDWSDQRHWQLGLTVMLVCAVTVGSIGNAEIPPLVSPCQIIGFGLSSIAALSLEADGIVETHKTVVGRSVSNIMAYATKLCLLLAVVSPIFFAVSLLNTFTAEDLLRSPGQFRLNTSSESARPLDIVVSRYDEPASQVARHLGELLSLRTISQLHPEVVVYNKNDIEGSSTLLEELNEHMSAHPDVNIMVKPLENVGRETDTYFEHIVSNWDDLAKHTIFMQADMHFGPWAYLRQIRRYFTPSTGFLSLAPSNGFCSSCEKCHDRDWIEDPALLESIFADFNQGAECRDVVLTYRGQFIASAARIRGNNVATYHKLLHELRQPQGVLHTAPYTESDWSRKEDSMSAPRVGFTLERMWGTMLQCNHKRIAYRCPAFLSSFICPPVICGKVAVEDCQCLDL